MAVAKQKIQALVSGVHNLLPNDVIPQDAASGSLNWLTRDGHIELAYGRQVIGDNAQAVGKSYGEHTAYRVDGTAVRYRKVSTILQYFDGTTWQNVITGLTASDVTFANYQSLAGAFVYIFSPDDGIYKICTANPTSYVQLYDAAANFKGYGLIDRARTILWGRTDDPTGLYGSHIDGQDSSVYTTVSGEATASLSGTLAFKAGGATRTCFGVKITLTGTGEVYTDNFNGVLTGSLGGTGTINYMSGAYTLSNSGTGTADYQWENSNSKGVTDFTYSGTRLAGEGFVVRQDAGGDPIKVVIEYDGTLFSLKENSSYSFSIDATDLVIDNQLFRKDIGVASLRSGVATGRGIVFMNTANISKPTIQILTRNPNGDNFDVAELFPHFKFANYTYTDAMLNNWDRYVVIACKSGSGENDTLLLCDMKNQTVDPTNYGIRTSCKVDGVLYGGDPLSQTTYELFTGFDDVGDILTNSWDSKGETYGATVLKKLKKARFQGNIDPQQALEVYISYDDSGFGLIGTILGTGEYVNYDDTTTIGSSLIGQAKIGGEDDVTLNSYYMEIKLRSSKFNKRMIRFKAIGYGYVSVEQITDFDIWTFEERMPSKYRSRQNVSLSGETDQ